VLACEELPFPGYAYPRLGYCPPLPWTCPAPGGGAEVCNLCDDDGDDQIDEELTTLPVSHDGGGPFSVAAAGAQFGLALHENGNLVVYYDAEDATTRRQVDRDTMNDPVPDPAPSRYIALASYNGGGSWWFVPAWRYDANLVAVDRLGASGTPPLSNPPPTISWGGATALSVAALATGYRAIAAGLGTFTHLEVLDAAYEISGPGDLTQAAVGDPDLATVPPDRFAVAWKDSAIRLALANTSGNLVPEASSLTLSDTGAFDPGTGRPQIAAYGANVGVVWRSSGGLTFARVLAQAGGPALDSRVDLGLDSPGYDLAADGQGGFVLAYVDAGKVFLQWLDINGRKVGRRFEAGAGAVPALAWNGTTFGLGYDAAGAKFRRVCPAPRP
jgi:hypothetical protein